jgi:hypothetical protein
MKNTDSRRKERKEEKKKKRSRSEKIKECSKFKQSQTV